MKAILDVLRRCAPECSDIEGVKIKVIQERIVKAAEDGGQDFYFARRECLLVAMGYTIASTAKMAAGDPIDWRFTEEFIFRVLINLAITYSASQCCGSPRLQAAADYSMSIR